MLKFPFEAETIEENPKRIIFENRKEYDDYIQEMMNLWKPGIRIQR